MSLVGDPHAIPFGACSVRPRAGDVNPGQRVRAAARRTGRDWTARTRDTALNALRYSRFVTVMKRALPLAAALLILAIIAYSLVPRQNDRFKLTAEHVGTIANDLAMIKPRLTGTDHKGNPFVITADMAIQDAANVKRATLKNVQADYEQELSAP